MGAARDRFMTLMVCFAVGGLCSAAPAPASAQGTLSIAVPAPEADANLSPLASGLGLWLRNQLADAGLKPVGVASGSADAVLRAANSAGADYALLSRLRQGNETVEVGLLLYTPATGQLRASARADAALESLGMTASQATDAMLAQLGVRGDFRSTPPSLGELACSSRADEARDDGRLYDAWREVQGKLSSTAMRLREDLAEEARLSGAPAAERARVLSAAGDSAGAWGLIGSAAVAERERPDPDPQLLLAAGEVQLSRGNPREALRYFERTLESTEAEHPRADAWLGLAEVRTLQSDLPGAREALEEAARLRASDPRPLEALASLLKSEPRNAAAHLVEAADRHARRFDPDRARTQYRRAARLDPSLSARAGIGIGGLESRMGRPAEALSAYQDALSAGVDEPSAHVGAGRAQRILGDEAGAERSFRRALALDARHAPALSELGDLYTRTGRAEAALPLLRTAHEVDARDQRIRRHLAWALELSGDPDGAMALLLGNSDRPADAESLRRAASIQHARGDAPGARETLARAVALEPHDAVLREELARVLEATGDAAAAGEERRFAALLSGSSDAAGTDDPARPSGLSLDELVSSFADQVSQAERQSVAQLGVREPSDWKTLLLRALWPRSPDVPVIEAALRSSLEARFAKSAVSTVDRALLSAEIDRLFDYESQAALSATGISTVNQVLGTDGVLVTRLVAHRMDRTEEASACALGAFELETRLLMGRDAEFVSILANTLCLPNGFEAYGRWNPIAFGAYALLLILVAMPAIRGWGTIHVSIRLPDRTKGFFSIHITTKPDQVRRERVSKKSDREKTRAGRRLDFLRRFQRHMAGRETDFRWIPARRRGYTVTVAGPLLDARGDEIIGHFLEEQKVRVRRRATSTLVFDFRPKECAVEVHVLSDRAPAAGGRVAVRGDLSSLRYARDGVAFVYLGLGSHTLAVGSHDSAVEVPLEIRSLESAIPLDVDLAEGEVAFRGCPEAVDPYLQGDLATAAEVLELHGDADAAHRIRAHHYQQQGRADEAARELEAAGNTLGAAELRATGDDFEGSASLYEEGGDHERAAGAFRAAGRYADAARCFELVYDYGNAIECWREVGDSEREMLLLEKLGEFMDAATLAHELGDLDRAISNLQQIDQRHVGYTDACRMIAEIVGQRGDHDLAVAKFEEAVGSVGSENASLDLLEGYAGALERAGRSREAVSAYEAIRRRDARRTDVATRIETLKRSIDAAEHGEAATARTEPAQRRYELLGEIGRGGMGVVYKARDRRLGRVVALKRLPDSLRDHPNAVALFEREARAAAALNHVNIVTLFDAGEENGAYFITMELLEGKPLNEILARHGRLTARDVARIGVQVASGLHYAHEQRIVHRDIKSANLFFTRDQVVKIMDFGIAKSLEEVRRSTTVVGGTPYYMAPEQAAGEPVDHRADLYAFGVTLFQLATGDVPFRDGDVIYRHRHEASPDPRELDASMPDRLAELILHLMAKRPDDRPASAKEAWLALRALLAQLGK
jgi:tetratricopeptide (TPR) repeat protein